MKKLLSIIVFLLAGCTASTKEVSQDFILPKDLEDCKIYNLRNENSLKLYIVRCPNSETTTTTNSKSSPHTTVKAGPQ